MSLTNIEARQVLQGMLDETRARSDTARINGGLARTAMVAHLCIETQCRLDREADALAIAIARLP